MPSTDSVENHARPLERRQGQETTVTCNNTLNYVKEHREDGIHCLGGTEYITNYSSSLGGSRQRYDLRPLHSST
jgi:hypothetical protein